MKKTYAIEVDCANCANLMEEAANKTEGVASASVNFMMQKMSVEFAEGADCLLTGEANHHHALDAKRLGLSLIAAGHYATEFPVTAAVAAALRTALPELEVLVSTENRDPYTYL